MRWKNRAWLAKQLEGDGLSTSSAITLAAWAEAALERRPVLFVGAGWTLNAEPYGKALTWKALASKMRSGLENDILNTADLDPLWLAELYRQRHGADDLLTVIREAVPDDQLRPGVLHRALLELRWQSVLTTNYDTLLERSFGTDTRVHVCVDDVDLVRSAGREGLELVHLHGVLARPKSIVLAFEDYRRYPIEHPGLLAKVRQLFLQHPVLFVGFSMTDPNFLQWSGWLSDVVSDHKNPWVCLTHGAATSLPHARYWGKRLQFVPVGSEEFGSVVPRIFGTLGKAIDEKDEHSPEVVRGRIKARTTVNGVLEEIRELLQVAERCGYDDDTFDSFLTRTGLFEVAASHVLDLADVPWRDSLNDDSDARTLRVDVRDRWIETEGTEFAQDLRAAFGQAHWTEMLEIVQKRVSGSWNVHRVHLANERFPDQLNRCSIPLGVEVRHSDPTLAALREETSFQVPADPSRAQDLRRLGYAAAQAGSFREAASFYGDAAALSRTEGESLRIEWLTLRSQAACLNQPLLPRDEGLENARRAAARAIRTARSGLDRKPYAESAQPINDDSREAFRKLVEELAPKKERRSWSIQFQAERDAANRWLDRLERIFSAPQITAQAAAVVGMLQWRRGNLVEGASTLARYGSKMLGQLLASELADRGLPRIETEPLIASLLADGRWPAEWMAKAEALLELLPACSEAHLAALPMFLSKARASINKASTIVRGTSTTAHWAARSTLLRLEAARLNWLPAQEALAALNALVDGLQDVDAHEFRSARVLNAVSHLPWIAWSKTGGVDEALLIAPLSTLFEKRLNYLASTGKDLAGEADVLLELFIELTEAKVISPTHGSPLRRLADPLVSLVAKEDADSWRIQLARFDGDRTRVEQILTSVLSDLDAKKGTPDRATLSRLAALAAADAWPADLAPQVRHIFGAFLETAKQQILQERAFFRDGPDVADLLAFAAGEILANVSDASIVAEARLVAVAIVDLYPPASEYLTAVPWPNLGNAATSIRTTVPILLAGRQSVRFSTIESRYSGMRAIARRILASLDVPAPWLLGLCAQVRASEGELARYATWILGEWIRQQGPDIGKSTELPSVQAALESSLCDDRLSVSATALRGLTLLRRLDPSLVSAEVLSRLNDDRAAVRRALEGIG